MSSERKTQSARANGAKSRGPKTVEGKAKSARNATTHGLNSQVAVLENESAERFQRIRDAYIADLAPRNQVEADLVDQIVVARWRLERTWTLETALLDCEISRQRPEIESEFEEIDEPSRIALAFKSLADNSRALALLNRYETRFTRTIHRAFETLRRLRESEKPNLPNEPNAPEKTDFAPHDPPLTPHHPPFCGRTFRLRGFRPHAPAQPSAPRYSGTCVVVSQLQHFCRSSVSHPMRNGKMQEYAVAG